MADVWTYFAQRERELVELSLHVDPALPLFSDEGGDLTRGRMLGPIYFNGFPASTYLKVHETVEPAGSAGFHRSKYSYYLVITVRNSAAMSATRLMTLGCTDIAGATRTGSRVTPSRSKRGRRGGVDVRKPISVAVYIAHKS